MHTSLAVSGLGEFSTGRILLGETKKLTRSYWLTGQHHWLNPEVERGSRVKLKKKMDKIQQHGAHQ